MEPAVPAMEHHAHCMEKKCELLEHGGFPTSHPTNINPRAIRKCKAVGKQSKRKALGLLYLGVERQPLKTELHLLPELTSSKYLNK